MILLAPTMFVSYSEKNTTLGARHHFNERLTLALFTFGLFTVALFACQSSTKSTGHKHTSQAQPQAVADTVKKSIPKEAHARINETHIMIKYHAPAVRGRTIWGGLVPYGEVWVTGAHSATSVEFDKPVNINGVAIPAGKYAFFTIPAQDNWTVIINKNWNQHLTDDYSANDDLVRVDVTPEIVSSLQERLKYSIVDKGNKQASIDVRWEKINISLPIKL